MRRPLGVVVADDEQLLLRLFEIVLAGAGMRVWPAGCGREAVDLLKENRGAVDVALLDVRMPGLSGPEALLQMRQMRPGLPCVFMTGDAGDCCERQLALAERVLFKPFAPDAAVRAVREAVGAEPAPAVGR
jgi:CheY-like chemotaxis protein